MSPLENQLNGKLLSCLTIDVEDWFHILASPAVPSIERWPSLESRIERNIVDVSIARLIFSERYVFLVRMACRPLR